MKENRISVIILIWKRDHLKEQIESLLNQTVLPKDITIIQNENHLDAASIIEEQKKNFPDINLIHSQENLKYFVRFSHANIIRSEYTFLLDDDIIPGRRWLERCLQYSQEFNAIVSCSGRTIPVGEYQMEDHEKIDFREMPNYFHGDFTLDDSIHFNYLQQDRIVDYGCNSYFFKTSWVQHFWGINPVTLESGEDIHLAASCKIRGDISVVVPSQTSLDDTGNQAMVYGMDDFASWKRSDFFPIREQVFRYMIDKQGWRPLLWN